MASTYCSLHVHIVFATKQRQSLIADAWRRDLHAYIAGTAEGLQAKAVAVGGVADHVHLLVGLRATHCLADFVRELKKAASSWGKSHDSSFAWQEGYAAFNVSTGDVGRVTAYIARQEEHHRQVSSLDELRALLQESGVTFDERYFE